ncbi:MAG: hypothetical protein A2X86_14575 [Bdellovibrionales bacterium GWA2_49_15]|nr:MAG: hypothetical protein A2X86_14575 [Bdellovibrionales bacterium GWA2_49_15]HAZ13435.1 hypothetical protein [Bdellovibrionales bacterium]
MSAKKVILAILFSLTVGSQAFATCQADYMKKIDSPILPRAIQINGNGISLLGYYGAYAIFGSAGAGIAGALILPLGLTLGLWGAKEIRNNPLHDIVRLLNESEYRATGKYPEMRTDVQKEVTVDGQTRDERRHQKRLNRQVRRHNRFLARFNKHLAKELSKSSEVFAEFHQHISEVATGVSAEQLAAAVKTSNDASELCTGKIGTAFGPVIEYKREIAIDGATKKERKQQERFNKKVRKHNEKMAELEDKNRLATKPEVIRYFQELL